MKKIVVGATGASGIIYAVRLLEALHEAEGVEVYTVFSRYAWLNLENETGYSQEYIRSLSDVMFNNEDLAAVISSGSFRTDGTVILPCSMKTLSAAANGYADNLISRVIDVAVKEKRKLVLTPRETPLSSIHLRNMLTMAECGALILPPMPAFYTNPESVDEIVSHTIMKILDYLDIGYPQEKRWQGIVKEHEDKDSAYRFALEEEKIRIEFSVNHIGRELLVAAYGGDCPHIGAVTIADAEGPQDMVLPGHRESVITSEMQKIIRGEKDSAVCVAGGIHIDNIREEQIETVKKLCREAAEFIRDEERRRHD